MNKTGMYTVSCPICKRQIIESSETDSILKCACGAKFNIWIHEDMICIQQKDAPTEYKAVQASRRRKYAELFGTT